MKRSTDVSKTVTPAGAPIKELSAVTLHKVTWRLIPFLFVLYVIAWLDRVNVGFAALEMNADLEFSSATFGVGSGIFFLGYCLFEIPSNIILERVGARLWIARIMVTWGLISAGLMLVRTPPLFYILRFLLGVAEAGFFPGVIFYLNDRPETTSWLAPAEREWLVETLAAERKACVLKPNIRVALTDTTVWKLGIIFLLVAAGFYGYSFWAPLVIKSLTGLSNFKVGLVIGAISAVTILAMLLNSYHSDRTGERALHIAVPLSLMAVGFAGCALMRQPVLAIVALALVPLGHCASYGPFWSMPTQFFTGPAAAAGIALVTTIANLGSFAGPAIIGALKARTGTHVESFLLLGGMALVAALLALRIGPSPTRSSEQPAPIV